MSVVLDRHRRRGVAMHRYAGALERIREALARGPMSIEEIAAACEIPARNVRAALSRLVNTGGVVRGAMPGQTVRFRLYSQPQPEPEPEKVDSTAAPVSPSRTGKSKSGSGVVAGPKVIRGYLW